MKLKSFIQKILFNDQRSNLVSSLYENYRYSDEEVKKTFENFADLFSIFKDLFEKEGIHIQTDEPKNIVSHMIAEITAKRRQGLYRYKIGSIPNVPNLYTPENPHILYFDLTLNYDYHLYVFIISFDSYFCYLARYSAEL